MPLAPEQVPAPTEVVVDRSWWSWAGAHGGHVVSLALAAMQAELASAVPVRTVHAHLLRAVDERPLVLDARIEHGGSRTSVGAVRGRQGGGLVLTATAAFGRHGSGPGHGRVPAPVVPPPEALEPLPLPLELVPFAQHVEIRPATAALPLSGSPEPELVAWLRFVDGRPVDAGAAVVLLDALPPALFATLSAPVAVPTVEYAVHLGGRLAAGTVDDWVLARIGTEHASGGWAVDDAALFDRAGAVLATGRQARLVLG